MPPENRIDDTDTNEPSSVVKEFYNALSFPPGSHPNYDAIAALFHRQATIVPPASDTGHTVKALNVADFLDLYKPQLEEFRNTGFRESEIFKSEAAFGNVAHYLSGYEVEFGTTSHTFRGINFFNLVCENGKWWIITLIWDRAAPPPVSHNRS